MRSIGIRAGKIEAISKTPLEAADVVDASGLVVSPGFINLHSHSVAEPGYRLELLDGVTTVLELEAGGFPIARFGQQLGDSPLTHFGALPRHRSASAVTHPAAGQNARWEIHPPRVPIPW